MKKLLFAVLLIIASQKTFGQVTGEVPDLKVNVTPKDTNKIRIIICAPSRRKMLGQPLFVILVNNKVIYKSDTLPDPSQKFQKLINPEWIKKIMILNGAEGSIKYGDMARNGVIELFLSEKNQKDFSKMLKDSLKVFLH